MIRGERLRPAVLALGLLALPGCSIAARSDKFGADLEIGIGGILSYIADLRLKASVGFSKTCTHGKEAPDEAQNDALSDPLGLQHFL
jgi:hypothetical protein